MRRRISRRFRPTLTPGLDPLESRQLLSSGFQVVTSPTVAGSDFTAVSAVSPTDIWAVGFQGSGPTTLAENFNGTTWSKVATPNPSGATSAELNGVSALSSSAVWAVGESSSGPLVEFFNGKSWSIQASPTITGGGGTLNAVDALSATDVWAVGNTGTGESRDQLIENFNGTSWSIVQAPSSNGALTGISAVSSSDIFAVGGGGKDVPNELVQFNGTTWSVVPNGPASADAVDAISATDVWAAGSDGLWNFNGATWSQVAFSNGNTANDFSAISGTTANNLFAVGSGFSNSNGLVTGFGTVAAEWNGTSWTAVSSVNPSTNQDAFTGVATLSNGTVVAVGNEIPGTGFIQSATFTVTPPATPIATTTALTATPGSTSFGAPVTLTATISPASTRSVAPTGAVDFFSGSTLLGSGTVSNDVATLATTALTVGTDSITAEYLGDPNYDASTSKADTVAITQATTTTAVSFSPAEPVLGQSTTLTAIITPAATGPASPTGTVEFFDGSTLLGSGTVSSDTASLATTALPLGTSTITATYEGDTNYIASTSPGVSVTVVSAATPASAPFQVVTSPTVTGRTLSAVSAVSATDIWAVGDQSSSTGVVSPLTENFNGTSWSVVAAPTPSGSTVAEFTSVSGVASNSVWAVGFSFSVVNGENVSTPLVEHFNGTSWSIQTTPATAGKLNGVAAVSATDVWAVGGTGSADLIENFNGTTWSVVQAPSPGTSAPSLGGISAISSTDIFAVGGGGKGNSPQVLQFNGTTWTSLANLPTGIATVAIDAISPTDVWTVGVGNIWNFNGTSWTETSAAGDLLAISGTSANDLFAVGETISTTDEPLVEQWNGTSWNVVASANPSAGANSFQGVTTLSNGTAVAVGTVGIETNATAAAPAVIVAGVHPSGIGQLPAASSAQAPVRTVSPNGTSAPPETSPVPVPVSVALGVVPDDIVQPSAPTPTRRR
jgi:hypothetical protein